MITSLLEKDVIIYKQQFERLSLEIYHSHLMERLSIDLDSLLFRIKYMVKHHKDLSSLKDLKKEFIDKSLQLREVFGNLMKAVLLQIPMENFSEKDILDIFAQDVRMDGVYIKFKMLLFSNNEEYLKYVDSYIPKDVFNIFPHEYFRFYTDSYNDGIAKAYPELFENPTQDKIGTGADQDVFCHSFTFQVTEACSLNCTYCVPGDTKILMRDFTLKNIEDVSVGDRILAFEEFPKKGKERTLIESKVLHKFTKESDDLYQLNSKEYGYELMITGDHPVVTNRGWKNVNKINNMNGDCIHICPDVSKDLDTNPILNDMNYIKGYFLGAFMGDGTSRKYNDRDGYTRYFSRFIVKDDKMNQRMRKYSKILGFEFHDYDFKISKKFNITLSSLLSRKKSDYLRYLELIENNLNRENINRSREFLTGYLAGIFDAEGSFDGASIRIINSNPYIMYIIELALKELSFTWTYDRLGLTKNFVKFSIRLLGGFSERIRFFKIIHSAIERKTFKRIIGKAIFRRDFSIDIKKIAGNSKKVYNIETDSGTYIANNFLVHNCYQFNKTKERMSFETGKKFIDNLLSDKYDYINRYNSPAIILEFIGGEPLLEVVLIRKLYEYFLEQCYELNHPWFSLHRLSICSNGLQYFDPEVQSFFKEYSANISFNISIDGNKELHDSCRIQPNGEGSYDIDIKALNHYATHYIPDRNSKMTLAPSNIQYLFESVKSFIGQGMKVINLNCVFEEGWKPKHALIEYEQLKLLSNHILENDLENIYLSIFNERQESVGNPLNDSNSCGGNGKMLSLRPNGQFYPCIRFMPTSVGNDVEDLCIGHIDKGLDSRNSKSKVLEKLDEITRRTQLTDICFECPIGNQCPGCTALSHTVFGTPNKKATFSCIMQIAQFLSNVYYWNNLLLKHPDWNLDVRKNVLPDEWSLLVINKDELDYLKTLECMAMIVKIQQCKKEEGNIPLSKRSSFQWQGDAFGI